MLNVNPTPDQPHVLIVGGGLAGLATAAALADRGVRISLIESRPRLGGRASSFIDPLTGESVDNCQHVSMTCCTNLADFCRRVNVADLFRQEPEIVFLSPEGRVSRLRTGVLPAPFHLAGSFLRANYLRWGEKLRVAYGLACLHSSRDDRPGESFAEWLLRHGQTIRTINLYWATVLVSALNERLEQMDVGHARKVFVDGFLRNRSGFRMELPLVPLGELYGTRLEEWLRSQDVTVRMTTGVRMIEADSEGTIQGVTLRSGESIEADFVVLAVPFDRVRALVPGELMTRLPALGALDSLRSAPITGVHLWFDRPVCPFEHVVTVGRLIHWVFNHTAIQGRSSATSGEYLQLVISASYDLLALDKNAILNAVMAELTEIWPAVGEATLVRSWVVTEHGATFAVRPGVEAHRPSQRTPIDGLYLAGDWTDTGWPATMEGAVRSGYRVAEAILEDLGSPAPIVCPELATEPLASLLLGPRVDRTLNETESSSRRNPPVSARVESGST